MQWSMRPRPVLAVLATMLAGLALAATASPTMAAGGPRGMPPPGCGNSC